MTHSLHRGYQREGLTGKPAAKPVKVKGQNNMERVRGGGGGGGKKMTRTERQDCGGK